ncbi:MAG: hypothetical protein H0U91_05185 [Rubrobacter sp.]|nr:hypothetical protein [Rubrobacter sp.]
MVSLKEFVARFSKVLVPGGIILGLAGGLIFNRYPILGGLLAAVGGVAALYSWWISEAKVKEHENFMEAQTILLAKGGLGNAITESVQNELRKGGLAKDVAARLRKALELTPDDVETLELLSVRALIEMTEPQPTYLPWREHPRVADLPRQGLVPDVYTMAQPNCTPL